jgi:hypothetical protein
MWQLASGIYFSIGVRRMAKKQAAKKKHFEPAGIEKPFVPYRNDGW